MEKPGYFCFCYIVCFKYLDENTRDNHTWTKPGFYPFTSLFISGAGWDCGARNARMYFTDDFKNKRVGGWCAATSENQWLQVDLGTNRYITAVGTQGF